MTRILLVHAGGELEMHRYKVQVPDAQLTRKMSELASKFFGSWEWADEPGVPLIDNLKGDSCLIAVPGSGEETVL